MNPNSATDNFEPINGRIDTLLNDYSNSLLNTSTKYQQSYPASISKLVDERRQFYKEFLEVGLHTTFVGVESDFTPISEVIVENSDYQIYSFQVTEKVILFGKSMISSAEEYPLVQSARWAIAHSANEVVKQKLNEYLENMVNSVNQSLHEEIKIELVLKHSFRVQDKAGDIIILEDKFDDKSVENAAGTDVAIWKGDELKRVKPDWTQWPDYGFFHTPVEELGKSLLSEYEAAAKNLLQPSSRLSFSHANTASYANSYSSNATETYYNGAYQNPTPDNHAYTYWACFDSANFVSQAIRYGGYAADGNQCGVANQPMFLCW